MKLYIDQFTYQLTNPNPDVQGKWFASNREEMTDDEDILCLHKDLVLRRSTRHNGKWSGYFDTREEVEQAIKDFGATVG